MHWKRLLFLLGLVAVLAALALLGGDREPAEEPEGGRALFPGLDAERVSAIEVEYLGLGRRIEVRKLGPGRWRIEAPYRERALAALPSQLAATAARAEAEPAEEERGLRLRLAGPGLPFDPPQALVGQGSG